MRWAVSTVHIRTPFVDLFYPIRTYYVVVAVPLASVIAHTVADFVVDV